MTHTVTLTLVTKNEKDWSSAFSLLSTVAFDTAGRFQQVSVNSYDNEDIVESEPTTYTEDTMMKVHDSLRSSGLDEDRITDIVTALQNAGLLFRERKS